ncbi:IS630 family transposase [Ralstonia pseudosolanacearum]|uniref:IS630 family transposase n=1 Tax=Ralstonia pseudosolanacearum TaxID=1310165 RepID=UPI00217571C6|nr:IS630 family transposase [Ralstonia pseudosolanacearum]UWD88110.1 IS630 family transposase [Ralstonia pseudosolanacearum]
MRLVERSRRRPPQVAAREHGRHGGRRCARRISDTGADRAARAGSSWATAAMSDRDTGRGAQARRLLFQAQPLLAQKKRCEEEFAVKADVLGKLQQAARDQAIRLLYLDEAGFAASSPVVQRAWSPRGLPHCVEPHSHCRRSVLGAFDYGQNSLIHAAHAHSIKGPDVEQFLDALIRQDDSRPTIIVLDNAAIHHSISEETRDRWFREHKALLFFLPPYSPELNMIEIVWKHFKYHWRRFVNWTRDTIDAELAELLSGYGSKFQINFS